MPPPQRKTGITNILTNIVTYILKMCIIVCTLCQYIVCITLKLTDILKKKLKGYYKTCLQFPHKTGGISAVWLFPCKTGISALSAFPRKTGIGAYNYHFHSNRHTGSVSET